MKNRICKTAKAFIVASFVAFTIFFATTTANAHYTSNICRAGYYYWVYPYSGHVGAPCSFTLWWNGYPYQYYGAWSLQ